VLTDDEIRKAKRLGKIISHPLRLAILDELGTEAAAASPTTLARLCGASIGNTSYHVTVLAAGGCLALKETIRRRGAVEHVYWLTDRGRSVLVLISEL
jgi:hypothetical protein